MENQAHSNKDRHRRNITKLPRSNGSKNRLIQTKTVLNEKSPRQTQRLRTELIIDCSRHRGSPIPGKNLGTPSFRTEHHVEVQNQKKIENQAHSNKDRHRRNLSNASYKIQNAVNHWPFDAPRFAYSWEELRISLFRNGTSRKHAKSKEWKIKRIQIKTVTDETCERQATRFRKQLIIDCSRHRGSPIPGRSLGTASFRTEHHVDMQNQKNGKSSAFL